VGRGRWTARGSRGRRTGRLVVAVAAVEAALVVSVGALAQPSPPRLIAPLALTTPTLDGALKPATEWADASSLPVPFAGHPATLWVKHDNTYLYTLLTVKDDRPQAGIQCCSATIYFDTYGLSGRVEGDDAMGFGPADQSSDQFFRSNVQQYADDRLFGGTEDTLSAGSYDAATGQLVLEARKPLCSADSAHDFCVKAGAVLGFTLDYFSSAGTTSDYPVTPDDAAHYDALDISPVPAADLAVKTLPDVDSVRAGDSVTFAMTVTNNGPGDASDVLLDAEFSATNGVRASLPPETCGCQLGTLKPGDSVTIEKTVKVTSVPTKGGAIRDQASVEGFGADQDPTNNNDKEVVDAIATPASGETVNASASAGVVSVRAAGTSTFVPLGPGQSIPVGSEVNASKGQVQIASQTPSGAIQTATASAGRFQVTQPKGSALTTLKLTAPIHTCSPGRGTTVLRRLSIKANGKFRTVGARGYAIGKTSKASWVLVDRCVPDRAPRSLASGAKPKKPPKRHLQTCVEPGPSNPSRHTQADAYDPAGHKQKSNCIPAP
jgi:Domain of unknown function DUF11